MKTNDKRLRGRAAVSALLPIFCLCAFLACNGGGGTVAGGGEIGNPVVTAVIVDSAGQPVVAAKVGLFSGDFNPLIAGTMGKRMLSASTGDSLQAMTDQNGYVEFVNVPPDSYQVVGIDDTLKYRLFKRATVRGASSYPGRRLALDTIRLREPGRAIISQATPSSGLWIVVPGTAIAQRLDSASVVTVLIPADTLPQLQVVYRPASGSDTVMQTMNNVVVAPAGVVDLTGIPDSISAPIVTPADTIVGRGVLLSSSARGAVSNKGAGLAYRFDWGDSTTSAWSADSVQAHAWSTAGSFSIRAQAREISDTAIVSSWSAQKTIIVTHLVARPGPLSYSLNPAIYVVGTAIIPDTCINAGGAADSFSITPLLPAGLSFNRISGNVTGTPTAASAATGYKVTGRNSAGSDSATLTITVVAMHTVTIPTTPANADSVHVRNNPYVFSTSGSTSNLGDAVQYQFDWGDSTTSVWSAGLTATKTWSAAATYAVRVHARSTRNTAVISAWSSTRSVTVQ